MATRNEVVDEPLDHECRHESQSRVNQSEEHGLYEPPLRSPAVVQDPREPMGGRCGVELRAGVEEKHRALHPDLLEFGTSQPNQPAGRVRHPELVFSGLIDHHVVGAALDDHMCDAGEVHTPQRFVISRRASRIESESLRGLVEAEKAGSACVRPGERADRCQSGVTPVEPKDGEEAGGAAVDTVVLPDHRVPGCKAEEARP